jgi:uncharacterized membrane protein
VCDSLENPAVRKQTVQYLFYINVFILALISVILSDVLSFAMPVKLGLFPCSLPGFYLPREFFAMLVKLGLFPCILSGFLLAKGVLFF